MDNWDRLKQLEDDSFNRKRALGLCIRCPEPYADDTITIFGTKATHKYNQLAPTCEKHFNDTIKTVEAFCGKMTEKEKSKFKLR